MALLLALVLAQEQPILEITPETEVRLVGARRGKDGFEFSTAAQYVEVDPPRGLDGIAAMTAGGWFLAKGSGEQLFFHRGQLEAGPNGERLFRPDPDGVNFLVGTDRHGFFMGAVNGNGHLPFPFVTLNEVVINTWNQLAVVKTADGYQKFYQNGALVWSDQDAAAAPRVTPFRQTKPGEPVRLSMPLGGTVGEAWIYARELTAQEIRKDYEAKQARYAPAPPGRPVGLREMDAHHARDLWKEPVTSGNWPATRERILKGAREIFGLMPAEKPPLDPEVLGEEDCGSYVRRKVSIQVEPGDRTDDGLLVPGLHDGMAAFPGPHGRTLLVRNHEVTIKGRKASAFGANLEFLGKVPSSKLYDAGGGTIPGGGGTTTLVFDTKSSKLKRQFLSLAGTIRNCAGGPTPWGSWISCEETTEKAGKGLEKDHGYVFEVPARFEIGLADSPRAAGSRPSRSRGCPG